MNTFPYWVEQINQNTNKIMLVNVFSFYFFIFYFIKLYVFCLF